MKKTLCLLLVMLLLCTMIPVGGLAGGGLGLFVSGMEVPGTTADVLGDGTVAFDASTSTLTLKSASLIAGGSDGSAITVTASSSLTELNIVLSGSNTISLNPNGGEADHYGIAINKGVDVKITGSGSLDITDHGVAKVTMSDPTKVLAAIYFLSMGSGSLTIGEADVSAPAINITCDSLMPFMAICNSVTNYGKITVSVPTAAGFPQPFVASELINYGTVKVDCNAYREDIADGTTLMFASGVNDGSIELTASTGANMIMGLFDVDGFTNNGDLKVRIGGDATIKASTIGIYSLSDDFLNTGSCKVALSGIEAEMADGIEAFSLDNTGSIDIKLTDTGRNDDDDDQIVGLLTIGPLNNTDGTINIDIGDSIAPDVSGMEAAASYYADITNTGKITVKIGNTPNADANGILSECDFSNLGSKSSVDITIGRAGSTPLGLGGSGLSTFVKNIDQTLTNEGTININILEDMPGQAIKVGEGKLINTETGKINAHARGHGLYLNTASLDNKGVIYAYAADTVGNGIYVEETVTNTGLIYATGGIRAISTASNSIDGSGSDVLNDDIDNLGLIDYNSSNHEYYVKDTTTRIKTFYSVTPLMAYKQAAVAELEEAMETEGYVSENAQQAMEYYRDQILNAGNIADVDVALAQGLQEMGNAEDLYDQMKADAKQELENMQGTFVSDEAKQIIQDAIDGLDFILNAAAFSDLLPVIHSEAEYAEFLYNVITELEKAKNNATSDEAKAALEEAIQQVKDAETTGEVNEAKDAGLKAAKEADKALKDAQDAAIAELEDAKSKAVSDDAKTALDEAIQKVKEATSQDAVAAAKEAGLKAADEADKALKDAIAAALAELDEAKVTASAEARTQIDAAKTKIAAATSVGHVEELLDELYDAIFEFRYVLIEGDGLEWVKDSGVTAKFRSSAPYEKFVSVEIDGSTVPASEYTSENGSTIIWLKSSMLGKLGVGKHKIVVRSKDGLAKGCFYVKPALPPTGDSAAPFLWTVLLMMSLGLAVTAIRMKRKEQ